MTSGIASGMTQEGMTPPYDLGSHFLEKCMGFLGQCQVFRLEYGTMTMSGSILFTGLIL